jgi:hypothetical protein
MEPSISHEEYFDSLKEAVERQDVDQLLEIYQRSRWMGALGTVGLAFLDVNARRLAQRKKLNPREGEYNFYDFVHDYDKATHSRSCKRNPNACLRDFARKGNLRLVRMAVEYGATDFNGALQEAAYENHRDIVEYLVDKGARPQDWIRRKFRI